MTNSNDIKREIDKALGQVNKAFDVALKRVTNQGNMQKLATSMARDIQKRVRLGYGTDYNLDDKKKFKPLSKNYVLQRQGKLAFRTGKSGKVYAIGALSGKELKSYRASKTAKSQNSSNRAWLNANKPKLDKFTTPKRSNVTLSGKLTRSIKGKGREKNATIYIRENRNDGKTNAEIMRHLKRQGRSFFYVTRLEYKRAQNFVRKSLLRNMKYEISKI